MAKVVRLQWRQFNKGWFSAGAADAPPPGTLRRALGIGDFRTPEVRTRNGSQAYTTVPSAAHSLTRFRGLGMMSGVGTSFFRELTVIKTGLSGARLTFLKMPPSPGQGDALYVAGGGTLFKVLGDGTVQNWGIAPPGSALTLTASGIATVSLATSADPSDLLIAGLTLQVLDYGQLDIDDATVTVTINGTPNVLTEGTAAQWLAATSNAVTAGNIAAAIEPLAGVTASSTSDLITVEAMGTGNLTGVYQYAYTYYSLATGAESDPSPIASITLDGENVTVSGMVASSDPQVTHYRFWRTTADGSTFLLLTLTDNSIVSFVDSTLDEDLGIIEMPQDRALPSGAWSKVAPKPWNGRAWIAGSTTDGEKGRVYYSAIGYPDGIAGFIAVTNDDDPTQAVVLWGGSLYVFTRRTLFQIIGNDEPFAWREVFGVVGTTKPHTVITTPYGICYQAYDGVRLFDGSRSRLIGWDAIAPTFRAERLMGGLTGADAGAMPAFQGVVGEFFRDEYHISDAADTWLAISLRDEAWRIILQRDITRFPAMSLYFDDVVPTLFNGTVGGAFYSDDEQTTDAGTAIKFDVETPHWSPSTGGVFTIRRLLLDLYTTNQSVTPSLVIDSTVYDLATVASPGRGIFDYPSGRGGHEFGVRLRGEVTEWTILYQLEAEVVVYGETGG